MKISRWVVYELSQLRYLFGVWCCEEFQSWIKQILLLETGEIILNNKKQFENHEMPKCILFLLFLILIQGHFVIAFKRERETSMQESMHPGWGLYVPRSYCWPEPATWVCALKINQTCNLLIRLQPTEPHQPGPKSVHFIKTQNYTGSLCKCCIGGSGYYYYYYYLLLLLLQR